MFQHFFLRLAGSERSCSPKVMHLSQDPAHLDALLSLWTDLFQDSSWFLVSILFPFKPWNNVWGPEIGAQCYRRNINRGILGKNIYCSKENRPAYCNASNQDTQERSFCTKDTPYLETFTLPGADIRCHPFDVGFVGCFFLLQPLEPHSAEQVQLPCLTELDLASNNLSQDRQRVVERQWLNDYLL